MGEKKLEEEKMTSHQFFLESKAYELRLDIHYRKSTISAIRMMWNLGCEEFEKAAERTNLYLAPERPPEVDEKYAEFHKCLVEDVKQLKWERREFYLRQAPWFLRLYVWFQYWFTCRAPLKLKRMVNKDFIHRPPPPPEDGDHE